MGSYPELSQVVLGVVPGAIPGVSGTPGVALGIIHGSYLGVPGFASEVTLELAACRGLWQSLSPGGGSCSGNPWTQRIFFGELLGPEFTFVTAFLSPQLPCLSLA